ncbi:hypothetical protein ACFQ78_41120 [Streptomyces sp. NPDC056519]|uniref:hypothetical protein n=1 Tax=Streptomyces sp. NPDC056519 TaxID=3345849 RepID=UPI0036C5202D
MRLIRAALAAAGAPEDLMQCLEVTGKEAGSALMGATDHVVAIGGSGTVRRAHESESNVLVHASVADRFRALCAEHGARVCDAQETERVRKVLWPDGKRLDRHLVGRTAAEIAMEAGIITRLERTMAVAARVDTCRVVVNQSTMTNTGGFSTGVPFTTVLADGSWGGCGMSGNITWSHLLNYAAVSRPIPERRSDPRPLFGRHRDPALSGDVA